MCEGLPVLVLRARLPGNFTARGVRGRKRIFLHCVLRRAGQIRLGGGVHIRSTSMGDVNRVWRHSA